MPMQCRQWVPEFLHCVSSLLSICGVFEHCCWCDCCVLMFHVAELTGANSSYLSYLLQKTLTLHVPCCLATSALSVFLGLSLGAILDGPVLLRAHHAKKERVPLTMTLCRAEMQTKKAQPVTSVTQGRRKHLTCAQLELFVARRLLVEVSFKGSNQH